MVRQRENFLALMENYGTAVDYMNTATNSSGTAMEKFENYQVGIEARIKSLQATFEAFSQNILNSGLVKAFLALGEGLLSVIDKFKILQVVLVGGALKSIPTLFKNINMGLNGFVANSGKFLEAMKQAKMLGDGTVQSVLRFSDSLGGLSKKQLIAVLSTSGLAKSWAGMSDEAVAYQLSLMGVEAEQAKSVAMQVVKTNGNLMETVSVKALTTAIREQIVALKTLLFSNPYLLIATGAIAFGVAVAGIIDLATVSIEEHKKKLESLNKEYEEASNRVNDFNSQLQTTRDRIIELENKGVLTLVESEELEKLKETNRELEAQLKIEESIAKEKSKEVNAEGVALFKKDVKNTKEYSTKVVSADNRSVYFTDWRDEEEQTKRAIKEIGELRQQLLTEEDKLKREQIQNNIDFQMSWLQELYANYKETYSKMVYIKNPSTDEDKASNAVIDYVKNFTNQLSLLLSDGNATSSLQNILNGFKGLEEELRGKLASGIELTSDMLNDDFIKALENAGFTVEQFLGLFTQTQQSKTEFELFTDTINEQVSKMGNAIDTAKSKMEELAKSYEDLGEALSSAIKEEVLSGKEIYNLVSKYPELDSAVRQTSDGYMLEESAVRAVIEARTNQAKQGIQTAMDDAKAILRASGVKVEANNNEIKSIRDLIMHRIELLRTKFMDLGIGGNMSSNPQLIALQNALAQISETENQVKNLENSLKYLSDPSTYVGGGKTAKEKADEARKNHIDAFKSELDALDHLKEMDKINTKQYYDGLADLNRRYYANRADYIEEDRENLEKLWNLQKEMLNEQKSLYEKALNYVEQTIDLKIDSLNKEKEALKDKNDEEDRAIKLQKLQENLAKAQQKTMRVLRGDTWVWEVDPSALRDAQQELDEFFNEEEIRKIEKEIDSWEEYKNSWTSIANAVEDGQSKIIAEQILGANAEAKILSQRLDNLEKFKQGYLGVVNALNGMESGKSPSRITLIDVPKYASGTHSSKGGIAQLFENGNELIINPPSSGRYGLLQDKSGVLPADLTKTIYSIATNPINFVRNALVEMSGSKNLGTGLGGNTVVQISNLSLPNVNDTEDFIRELKLIAQNH